VLVHASRMVRVDAIAVVGSEQSRGEPSLPVEPETFSAFGARVLNQLSLSAWLPGAFFIVGGALLAWFRAQDATTLGGLGSYVGKSWVPILVLALPALVITTLLTQAFSFEAIRTLEGYWRRRGPASWLLNICIRRQLRRKTSLTNRFQRVAAQSFSRARPSLLNRRVDGMVLLAIEADLNRATRPTDLTSVQEEQADTMRWWDACQPWDSAKLIRLRRDLSEFPKDSRVMATKLGNLLRTEDRLRNTGGDIEGFVMRHREKVPPRVLAHHDQFRTRLDMYCTLVFVSAALAIAAVPALWQLDVVDRVVAPLALFVISCASYGAAVSSARGYSTVLRQIDTAVAAASAPAAAE
jgi:hypothetical protein